MRNQIIKLIHHCTSCEECRDEDIADHLIANGVMVQQWTSVAEQLPNTEQERSEDGDLSVTYEVSEWLWGICADGKQGRVRYETGPVFQGWYDDLGTTHKITHWMPLPTPPREV